MLGLFKSKRDSRRARILVVDDAPEMVDALKYRLESYEYDVISAADGKEGLAKVLSEKPDLVLLDIGMPVMDGYNVLAQMRGHPKLKDIPVIMVTAHFEAHEIAAASSYGIADYVVKPFHHKDLMDRIADVLQKKGQVIHKR
ncbi:MAG: hypothetical protein DRP65_09280 [Planctomycetota bacterium]|nr:MAG: hypothetical protein DRP65_09280 [Planctomycetota bacterium]